MKQLQLFLVLLFLGISTIASAQSLNNVDFASLDVDELSDEQITQIAREIESRGLTIQQAVQIAIAQGMPRSEAVKLSRRLNEVQIQDRKDGRTSLNSSRLRTNPADTNKQGTYLPGNFLPDSLPGYLGPPNSQFAEYLARQDSIFIQNQMLKEKIFGFELFEDSKKSFEPSLNIPTPENYQLGPGDEVLIDIYGAAQNTYQLEISPDGSVFIDNVGPVYLNGLTMDEAENKLRSELSQIYSGISDPSGNVNMQVSLGQIRSIKVTLVGEVDQPGTYTLPSLASVFNALYAAGGPSLNGSMRKIEVIRGDSAIAIFDVYDLLINSNQSSNIRLEDQDIIKINPYISRVEIEGQVKRPGIYEMQKNETLADLIEFSGGFTGDAYTGRIKVIGSTDREKRINDINKGNFDSFNLKNGDKVTVGKILDRFENIVEIRGAVFRDGRYQLTDSSTVYNLIQRADGLKEDAFMNRGIIYRENPDLTTRAISFNVGELMNNPAQNDVALKENDVVLIQSIFDLRENYTVRVIGPVQNPNTFEYIEGMTLEDIIFQAGGFKQSAAPYRIEVARRVRSLKQQQNEQSNQVAKIFQFNVDENLELDKDDANFTLQPFDNVYIRQLPNYSEQKDIKVVGEVEYPGTYSMQYKTERISDVIERAGGLTEDAYIQGATLFRKREFLQQEAQRQAANIEGLTEQQQQEQLATKQTSKIGIELDKVLNNPKSKYDLILQEGDSLFVPTLLQTVTVTGGVFYPTSVRFEQDKSYEDYITAAGGFTGLAKKNRSYVIYANGEVDKVQRFLFFKNYPEVRPGATLVVPEQTEQRKLTPGERVNILSAIISTAALITTTIVQITR
ncbi:MAG: SLBB domain-containing protein [Balneolaceae bacterium]|nr:SLBB domain-containing protein [Balneolaceae bacterium]